MWNRLYMLNFIAYSRNVQTEVYKSMTGSMRSGKGCKIQSKPVAKLYYLTNDWEWNCEASFILDEEAAVVWIVGKVGESDKVDGKQTAFVKA